MPLFRFRWFVVLVAVFFVSLGADLYLSRPAAAATGAAASAAGPGLFCSTKVVPSATTLTPSTPMATHSHLAEAPREPAPEGVRTACLDEEGTIRLMISLRKIQVPP